MTAKNIKEPRVDFVRDTTRAARLFKKIAMGEMSVQDLFFDSPDIEPAATVSPPVEARADDIHCPITEGCICCAGHNGGCVIDATPKEEKP